jgi:hypothetical protein
MHARAVISRHVPLFSARMALSRTRTAAVALQRAWRAQAARRAAAATALQAAVRGWIARRRAQRALEGIVKIQAAWRGCRVRRESGRNGREARARIEAAAAAAAAAPQRRIGARAREALKVLLASKQCAQVRLECGLSGCQTICHSTLHTRPTQTTNQQQPTTTNQTRPQKVITAVSAIEFSTRYSKECCALIADSGGVGALLAFMRSCNRSKPHAEVGGRAAGRCCLCCWCLSNHTPPNPANRTPLDPSTTSPPPNNLTHQPKQPTANQPRKMLRLALAVLHNVARWRDLAPLVLAAPDCVAVLSERLQMFRDMEVGDGGWGAAACSAVQYGVGTG